MWSFDELQNRRHWTVGDIPPPIQALVPELDLACLADDGELDRGLALHLLHEATYDWPAPDTPEWVQAAIAANLQTEVLPGFKDIGGAYQLHTPCSPRHLTWLRHLIYRLVGQGQVVKVREKRPDLRQPRGWDWMACLYPAKKGAE
jgi:hypothetical protein